MTYKNRADLLIAAGESIRMQGSAGIEPVCKCDGTVRPCATQAMYDRYTYEFPLAVVEGKPVFSDSVLYDKAGYAVVAGLCWGNNKWNGLSFTPPKPKTVTVELLREDAERLANCTPCEAMKAIRKALDKQK